MLEVRRSIAQLQRDSENYEKDFKSASLEAEEISRLLSKFKPSTTTVAATPDIIPVVDEFPATSYAESSSSGDVTSDTASVCSSETSNSDLEAGSYSSRKIYGSNSLYDLDEKPTAFSAANHNSSRSKKGADRYRSRRRSQH